MSSHSVLPPSSITGKPTIGIVVDYTIERELKKELNKPSFKEKSEETIINELTSRISEILDKALIENGYGYGEKYPATHYRTKIYDRTEKAVQRLFTLLKNGTRQTSE